MGMGIVTDQDFEKELNNCVVKSEIRRKENPGRKEGDNNVPDSLRKIIGETGATEGRQEALSIARSFGISDSSVSAYTHGATSTVSYDKKDKGLVEYIRNRKEKLTKKAMHKLTGALDSITPDKLKDLGPRHAAGIARDMSAIVKNLEPSKDESIMTNQQNNQFIFYRPQFMKESDFDTIEVSDR